MHAFNIKKSSSVKYASLEHNTHVAIKHIYLCKQLPNKHQQTLPTISYCKTLPQKALKLWLITKVIYPHIKDLQAKCNVRDKALIDDASKENSCCVKLFVWILVKESVLFKQVPQHALKHFL